MRRMVFLDRDGTINKEKHYLSSPDEIELLPGAVEGIQLLRELGLPIAVVTNQSAIGRGYFDSARLESIHDRLEELLAIHGTYIDEIYYCPHHPDHGCDCRKPASKLALRAAKQFQANLSLSFMIGDKLVDIEFGKKVGMTTILVKTGYGGQDTLEKSIEPDYIANDLLTGARRIEKLITKSKDEKHV